MKYNRKNTEHYELLAFNLYGSIQLVNVHAKIKSNNVKHSEELIKQQRELERDVFNAEHELQTFLAQCGADIFEPDQPDFITPK